MNKQRGTAIGYADYSWNVIGGCKHNCGFFMPDGQTTGCYAKDVAEGVAKAAYPRGFVDHYWRQNLLGEPSHKKEPSVIFIDSMADLFGWWVPAWQIEAVLKALHMAPQHTFLSLTKNAPRLSEFAYLYPDNLWVGVSVPPSHMNGVFMDERKQRAYLIKAFDVLTRLHAGRIHTWMSFEPLSFDAAHMIRSCGWYHTSKDIPLDWAAIGAASKGKTLYQPDSAWVMGLLDMLDCPIYMKENLDWGPRRTERATAEYFEGPF